MLDKFLSITQEKTILFWRLSSIYITKNDIYNVLLYKKFDSYWFSPPSSVVTH